MLPSTTATHIGHIDWTLVCGVVVGCFGTPRGPSEITGVQRILTVGVLRHRGPWAGLAGRGHRLWQVR